jgi:hypothetical protein
MGGKPGLFPLPAPANAPHLLTNLPPHPLYVQKGNQAFDRVRKHPMSIRPRSVSRLLASIALPAILCAAIASAQTPPVAPRSQAATRPAALPAQPAPPISDKDLAATQKKLIELLRLSPTLTSVVARDPSLLANQEYVQRNNPQLGAFLAAHPEVARNPEFYLFTHVHPDDGSPDQALERAVWPQFQPRRGGWDANDVVGPIAAMLAFACFLGALVWLIRQFLENRRWSRIFKLQSEVHGRLIDKFSSTQELASYMGTEAGRRFLEAAPIPVGFEPEQRVPNVVARVLTPLQIGIVLVLLGAGFLLLRNIHPDAHEAMLILGTIALMPGLGFIISAGITWVLAGRLGLMPESSPNRLNPPSHSSDQL